MCGSASCSSLRLSSTGLCPATLVADARVEKCVLPTLEHSLSVGPCLTYLPFSQNVNLLLSLFESTASLTTNFISLKSSLTSCWLPLPPSSPATTHNTGYHTQHCSVWYMVPSIRGTLPNQLSLLFFIISILYMFPSVTVFVSIWQYSAFLHNQLLSPYFDHFSTNTGMCMFTAKSADKNHQLHWFTKRGHPGVIDLSNQFQVLS